ncbi:glutathione S-transferase family protein [Pantoea sp. FN0305]|uniref:glutathione S-transferase family protein n=1 Tax=Pantoea sp. FN0305 TaxID=3418559 RepID=UPI003CEEF70A
MTLKIYTYPKSRSLRVLWTLEEMELPYQPVRVALKPGEPGIRSPHPQRKVPVLEDGSFFLAETQAICKFICTKYAGRVLYPVQPEEQAIIDQWLSFAITELEAPVWLTLKHKLLLPESARVKAVAESAATDAQTALRLLSQARLDRWIAGENFTLADIFLAHNLAWAQAVGLTLSKPLADYVKRCFSRPASLRAVEMNNR